MGAATVTEAAIRGGSRSPKTKSPPKLDVTSDSKADQPSKTDGSNAEPAKPLAPPPRPGQQQQQSQLQQSTNTPDYFGGQPSGGSLNLEPNPFEQSFGGGGQPETPGGTKLPSVASLTSPSAHLPVNTPFNWGGGSLRTGPLSPAMLSGPANDYFGDTTHHLRGGFPTPNESSLRSGLTPGGSGSMFPAPSPNSQFIAQLASGGATPNTLDFHRTALSAASKRDQPNGNQAQAAQQQQSHTSQPQEMSNGATSIKAEPKPSTGPFDPHDNDAANGLFMLAQGRNGAQPANQFAVSGAPQNHGRPMTTNGQAQMANMNASANHARGPSEGSNMSEDMESSKPATRGKGKKNPPVITGRRKAEEAPAKPPPSKKPKNNVISNMSAMSNGDMDSMSEDDDDDMKIDENGGKVKMTDEEKRKNFLERNRVAALKCRQRKKQWLANLQSKVEIFSNENDALTAQITQLREEVVNLKTLLLAHKDCPVTQQQGMHGAFMQQVVEPYNAPQMNPYGMGGPMSNQQVMAGQRRFS